MMDLGPLQQFVDEVSALLDVGDSERALIQSVSNAMRRLVARDDWLPEAMAKPHPRYYQQYLLYADPRDRFSVVSFVWGPGQRTPVHDHTVWGVIGMLRGAETAVRFTHDAARLSSAGDEVTLVPGDIEVVSPSIGDIHQVSNAYTDRVSISIHAYGANIGKVRRHVFDPNTGATTEFISGYANP
jgi:3-mercaptopropionate dioxygenase